MTNEETLLRGDNMPSGSTAEISPQPPGATARLPLKNRFTTMVHRLGPAAPLAVISGTLPMIGGAVLIGLITRLAPWLRAHPTGGLAVYTTGVCILVGLGILPTFSCAILAGWVFGIWVGFPISMASFCAAAILAYAVNSFAAGDRVVRLVAERPKWEAVRAALLASGFWKSFWIITLLRLPPLAPFAPVNFVLATTRAPRGAYLLGTLVGMAPRTMIAVWAAAHASHLDFKSRGDTRVFFASLAATLLSIGVVGYLARKAVRRVTAGGGI